MLSPPESTYIHSLFRFRNGIHGKIAYTLEAKLSRSMRMAKTAVAEFTFITKNNMVDDTLLSSQSGSVQKKMKLFTSGKVSMNANMERMGYMQGERMRITADIENKSSRALVPKFSLDQTQTFIAQSSKNSGTKRIFKEVGETIPSSTQQTITKELCIPPDLQPSILNCSIMKVEYILKVYLDVPYARDPEIILPLVIFPVSGGFAQMMQSCSSMGLQSFGNINQAGWNIYPPQIAPGPYAPPPAPGAYAPPSAPGAYAPPAVTGAYAPQTTPGPFAPQPVPELYPSLPDQGLV
ncbi:arrestin domain-containing protein 3-like [Megalops cyprinoides]|uniref:arrestin domain-containing protein 3-like n=1 Tax=Megalops cyprinoides TaxID=118141 RepID=UPI00186545C0|nr:arrestin domain-containing protein 3-like [Megalops cyprinoides]